MNFIETKFIKAKKHWHEHSMRILNTKTNYAIYSALKAINREDAKEAKNWTIKSREYLTKNCEHCFKLADCLIKLGGDKEIIENELNEIKKIYERSKKKVV